MLKAFHVIFLKTMWVKRIFWDRPCDHWPCSESSPQPTEDIGWGRCIFLQPSVLVHVKCPAAVFPLLLPKAATRGQHITLRSFVLLAKLIFIFSWSRTKKPLDESESGEWKSWLKAQHSENEDHGIRSYHFMGNRWGNSGNSVRLFLWAPKSLQMVTAAMKLKDAYSLEGKLWPT